MPNNHFQTFFNVVEKRKKNDESNYLNFSKKKLLSLLRKKCMTIFVGDISRIEKYFGELWGHGKPQEDLTHKEQHWRDVWSQCREEILDNGNSQSKAIEKEVVNYTVRWNRFRTFFGNED